MLAFASPAAAVRLAAAAVAAAAANEEMFEEDADIVTLSRSNTGTAANARSLARMASTAVTVRARVDAE